MDDSHLPGKASRETTNRLRREGNLRHKNDRLLTALNDFFCRAQVNFRLAGTCHTLKKK
jgi:hypothetical protein